MPPETNKIVTKAIRALLDEAEVSESLIEDRDKEVDRLTVTLAERSTECEHYRTTMLARTHQRDNLRELIGKVLAIANDYTDYSDVDARIAIAALIEKDKNA